MQELIIQTRMNVKSSAKCSQFAFYTKVTDSILIFYFFFFLKLGFAFLLQSTYGGWEQRHQLFGLWKKLGVDLSDCCRRRRINKARRSTVSSTCSCSTEATSQLHCYLSERVGEKRRKENDLKVAWGFDKTCSGLRQQFACSFLWWLLGDNINDSKQLLTLVKASDYDCRRNRT